MWVKSSFDNGGTALEVMRTESGVLIQDSQNRRVVLALTVDEWERFVAGVKAGDFDL